MAEANDKKPVKVLGAWPSPFVMRPRLAFNIKKVEYELVEECIFNKSELLLRSNPIYKKIPVLLHDDLVICESMIIVEYIDGVWNHGTPILPVDPYDRAQARFWATYIDDKIFSAGFMGIAKAKTLEEGGAGMEQLFSSLLLLEDVFDKCSKGKKFFNGDTIGYLDIALGCFLGLLRAAEKMSGMKLLDEVKMPLLARWAKDFCDDEVTKSVMPETEQMVEFFKMYKAKMAEMMPPSAN